MTKLIKTSSEVQVHNFGELLGEALERVEESVKKPVRKKRKRKALVSRLVHNSAFDVLVTTGRTSCKEPNIANLPRRGDELREIEATTVLFSGFGWSKL